MPMDDRVEERLEDLAPWAEERDEDYAPCWVEDRLEDYTDCVVEERDEDYGPKDEERLEDYAADLVQESNKGRAPEVPKLKWSALSDREVVRLYDALSFALWQFGPSAIMSVHITILWKTLGVTDHTRARQLLGQYFNRCQKWAKATEIPVLVVTNPFWLWAFGHGVEDPNWGRRPIDQHALAVTIHELASKINDMEMRKQIQGSAAKLLLDTAQRIVKEPHSGEQYS